MYLLDFIDDASLRAYMQRAIESRIGLSSTTLRHCSCECKFFREKSDDEIVLWNEIARLLANAIIYFKSMILNRLLEYFEKEGDAKKLEIIKQLSPVA